MPGKMKDLKGQKFGKLTVIEYAGKNDKGVNLWLCQCECGNTKLATGKGLRSLHTRSCGCIIPKAENLVGKRFGRLVVLERADNTCDKAGRSYVTWKCKCDCGNETLVTTNNLHGKTRSCGCYLKSIMGTSNYKHGLRKSRLYNIYNGMKQRCNNPNNKSYKFYGGRGVKVCDEWNRADGLCSFGKWALKSGYEDDLTLDRIDYNGDYSPDNCRWTTMYEQYRNTRKNVWINDSEERLIIADYSRKYKLDHRVVSTLVRKGLSSEEIKKELKVV